MTELKGRVALVTGSAVRVGRVLALSLARAGVDVAVHHNRSLAEARATAFAISEMGARATLVQGDLVDADVPARLLAEASAELGPVDILVNNASLFDQGRFAATDLDVWSRMQRINLRAPLLLSQAFAAALPADREGDIVNLNDIHALRPRADYFAYTQSKAALHDLTRNLALALAPRVRVNEIALGAVLPPASPPESYAHVSRDALPLRRFPTPDDVADALLFLLGCRAVTGQTIRVDSGEHLSA